MVFGWCPLIFSLYKSYIAYSCRLNQECGRTLHHLQLMFCDLPVLTKEDASCEARHSTDTYGSYICFQCVLLHLQAWARMEASQDCKTTARNLFKVLPYSTICIGFSNWSTALIPYSVVLASLWNIGAGYMFDEVSS